jgi:AP2 domain
VKTVSLYGRKAAGRLAVVDDGDYDLVMAHRWSLQESHGNLYAITNIPREGGGGYRSMLMHKLITGWPVTDHKNHNGLDNRRHNLRPATGSQNMANMRPHAKPTSSRYKGVGRHKVTGKWAAYIGVNGRRSHLGLFVSEVDAALAYDAAALAAWGEFAYLNFPESPALTAPSPAALDRPEPRICAECHSQIPTTRQASARYCSKRCGWTAHNRSKGVECALVERAAGEPKPGASAA